MTIRVLIAGESWVTHSIHQKGFDSFTTTTYCEGVGFLRNALVQSGYQVDFIPNHLAPTEFPSSAAAIREYGAVILSDIGSNTLLLHPETFEHSTIKPNRLTLLRDYVAAGGGLIMVGGYLTFQGIEGRARYAGTAVEEALPVTMLPHDDRVEVPEGCSPVVLRADHPVVAGLPGPWPSLLGYNRVLPKSAGEVVATVGIDPLLAVWTFGEGRAAAFTSDCGPHWCPPPFVEWSGYNLLWQQLVAWVAGR
ncbi:MAG TPA: glutamine amidotransferase [Anaerolineae bacterium]|nr:glutamine amidotransferase [Anaerolineae bacterium]